MKFYNAENSTAPIEELDLGTVEAGKTKDFQFFIHNDSEAFLDKIEISTDSSEVKIISAPKTLKANEKVSFFVQYSPSITLKQGLKTNIKISAYEIWG
jgi:hypothetical protein